MNTLISNSWPKWYHCHTYELVLIYCTPSGLTTLAKNRETWLLPQRTWVRSEGMTGRHVFAKMWVFSLFFAFVSLLISFIFNIKSMFCICFIIIIDLIFIDFRFIHFALKSQWHLKVRFLPPISYIHMIAVFKT